MTDILRVENLNAGYGPLGVLHSVSLTVRAGERVGIIGLNGHGKSTLLKAIVGLTGWQSGSVRFNGVEIGGTRSQGPGRQTHRIVRMGLSLMPQGDALFHGMSVADHLDSGAYSKRAWRERRQRRELVLGIFPPLEKLLAQPVGKLSGGERRMVSLARGLMDDAKLLLIDEPSLGLAPKISKGLIEALMKIDLRDGAMVIAEQNLSLLQGNVTRLVGLHAGKLKGGATSPDALLSERLHPSPNPLPQGEGANASPLPQGEGANASPLPQGEGADASPLPQGEGAYPSPLPLREGTGEGAPHAATASPIRATAKH